MLLHVQSSTAQYSYCDRVNIVSERILKECSVCHTEHNRVASSVVVKYKKNFYMTIQEKKSAPKKVEICATIGKTQQQLQLWLPKWI